MKRAKTALVLLPMIVAACAEQQPEEQATREQTAGINMADLDTITAPCEDFYQFVAGGWMANNPVPATEARWGNFNILVEENNKKVRLLLDSVRVLENLEKGSYVQLVGDMYNSAMDSAAVEEKGLEPMQPIFERIDEVDTREDYYKLASFLKMRGIAHPWYAYVSVDDKDSESYILQVGQSGLGLPDRDYYLKSDSADKHIQEEYRKHIARILELSGYAAGEAEEAAENIYDLERHLAEKQMSRVERRVPENVYNKRSRGQVVDLASELNLDQYFDDLGIDFDSAVVGQVDYMKSLSEVLGNTSVQTLKAYARWHAIDGNVAYLPYNFVEQNFNFYGKVLGGNKEMKPRWRRSLDVVNGGLGEQVGRLFVDRYFPSSSKREMEQMVEDLRSAYRERIEALPWMSDSTKERALEKLEAFKYKIGYPGEWKDYSDLEISPNDYFRNGQKITEYTVRENLDRLGTPVDKDEWFMPPHKVNAYYSGSYNEIVFPAGILQPPFYDPEADAALNYGAIGGVIGHEFTHGFDDRGRKYNALGNMENWWTRKDMERFESRTDRMVKQYSEYQPLKETFVSGELTLGENIADLGGLTLAYYAYKNSHVEDGGEEPPVLQGFTWQQRIFIGWGRVWQSNQTEEYLRKQVVTDPHSPAQFRVNGPMSNMPEFKEAWGCDADDPMVRPDSLQVVIW